MKVLTLCSYPIESAATRYRLAQFVEPLKKRNIDLKILSFLDSKQFARFYSGGKSDKLFSLAISLGRRFLEVSRLEEFDIIFVQREAMLFGPAFFESLYQRLGKRPMILDLDDATYVRYISPTYGKIGSFFKFFGKTDSLIRKSDLVICGNRFIADYAEKKGTQTVVVPTVVDTDKFCPKEFENPLPVIGWIGTHSTFPFLESLFPILEKLAEKHQFILKIVGSGRERIKAYNLNIENLEWKLEREISDFRSLDIGLYPMKISDSANEDWLLGKSGFKAIQYLAVGIPFVMTPIGVCAEIGEANRTHFNATIEEDWYNSLNKLLSDENLRRQMGAKGRKHSLQYYTVPAQAEKLFRAFQLVFESQRRD